MVAQNLAIELGKAGQQGKYYRKYMRIKSDLPGENMQVILF